MKKNDKVYVAINASQIQDTLEAFGHNDPISKKILSLIIKEPMNALSILINL